MAKTTVEILGGSLDGTVLNNMASEATMREILRAVNKMGGGSGGSGGGGGAPTGRSSRSKLTKSMDVMSSLAEGLGNQIGNAVGALGTMGAMLATGNTKLSSYTKTLNDQIISKLPIFGGLLGGVGGLLNDGIEVLEDWNEALKKGTETGATFGNSILRASKAATRAGMDMDEYIKLINQYSSTMLNLGDTVTQGAERFSNIANKMVRAGGTATRTLLQMGYSTYQVNESFLKYIEMMGMGLKLTKTSDKQLAEDFDSFQLNLIRMGYLTGQNVKKLEEQMAVVTADTVFKMQLATLSNESRKQMMAGAQHYTAMYGEAGGELFKALFLGMPPGSEEARNLMVLMPELVRTMRRSIDTAKKGQGKIEDYIEQNEELLIQSMLDSARRGKGIEGMLAAAGAGYGDAEKLRKSIEPILRILVKQGDLTKITSAQLRAAFAEAKKEANERDKLTEFLNNFSIAMRDLKYGLMEFLIPILEDLGLYLERKDLPGKVKQFGNFIKESVERYLPDVITFFKWLGDENGRAYIMNEVSYFFAKMGLHFEYYVREAFGFRRKEEYTKELGDELAKVEAEYESRKKQLKPAADALRYRPPAQRTEAAPAPSQSSPPPPSTSSTGLSKQHGQLTRARIEKLAPHLLKQSDEVIDSLTRKGIKRFGPVLPNDSGYRLNDVIGSPRGGGRLHKGQDYGVAEGTKVMAAFPGTVRYFYDTDGGGGYVAELTHADDPKLQLLYMHLTEESAKNKPSRTVNLGEEIAKSGKTGGAKYGGYLPHLHAEGRYGGRDGKRFNVTEFSEYNTGTLGQHGTLFKNFGKGTNAILHNTEAVLTPQQMNAVMNSGSNVATAELLDSIDRNFQRLATIMVERTNLSQSQLSYIERQQIRIA